MAQIDKEATLTQLKRICKSVEFSNKPLMSKFVSYLVNEYLEGRGDQLKGYTIAIDLFKQGEHFDPDQNALVRIHAGRLRRSLKSYYLEEGKEDPIHIEIPKGRYCPVVSVREVTSSGPSFTVVNEVSDNTITVMPFRNLSKSSELDDLVIGLSYELSDALTAYKELKVIGFYGEMNNSLSSTFEIEKLKKKNVSFLVSGDVLKSGNKVKVSCRLINLHDDSQVWSKSLNLDKETYDLFEIQEKICRFIAGHLGEAYGVVNKYRYQKLLASKPTNPSEQELLLKHNHAITVLTPELIQDFYKQAYEALDKNPESVLANALVASINQTIYGHDLPGAEDAYIKFGDLAEKAYNLNPNHKLAFTNLVTKSFYYNERDRLFSLFEEGQKWLPYSPMGLGLFGLWFSFIGEWDLGKELIETVFEKNIYVPSWYHSGLFYYYYNQHDYENALQEAIKFQLHSTWQGPIIRVPALAQVGKLDEAKREFARLLNLRPDFQERGRHLFELHIKLDTLVDHILEGYEKIGVKID